MIICLGCMRELNTSAQICPYCGYDSRQKPEKPYFLEPGTILENRYVLGKSIGNGGFGITYIGFDLVLNRRCAVKEYYPRELSERPRGTLNVQVTEYSAQEQFRLGLDSFLSEAQKLAEFADIPQVVNVYDCIRANQTGYIVMEYIPGLTIGEILKKQGCYSYEEARNLMIEVLKGLVCVHRANMIHRDIAPDNIMVTPEGQVKLIDFGASRQVLANRTQNYSVILKPGYAPIEQYSVSGRQGPWTDVYAVGATFYRMITGVKLPSSLDRSEHDTLEPPSRKMPEIPRYADQVILYALEIRGENRLQSAEDFLDALEEERTLHRKPEKPPAERLGPLDYVKMIAAFVGVMLFTAFLVCCGLEKAVNGKNIIYEIVGRQYMQENAVPEEETRLPSKIQKDGNEE